MKIVIAPDSFKGSLSATEAANAVQRGIFKVSRNVEVQRIPMADGGEGTVEAMITAAGGEIKTAMVTGPLGEKVMASYGILEDKKTGIVEMAQASGLTLIPVEKRNPLIATSFGTGELIKRVVDEGCTRIIIGIGGSATNDGGMGMAQALGIRFYDSSGRELGLGGGELIRIDRIDVSGMYSKLRVVQVIAACDVNNPLCGPTGTSEVFGPQKGADKEMVDKLDKGLMNFGEVVLKCLGKDILMVPGAGAAGGMGAGLMAFLQASLMPGIQIVTELAGLEEKIKDADLVITGEGNTDYQTAFGKVPVGISRIAKIHQVPVICLSGGLGEGIYELYKEGITAIFSIINRPMGLDEAMINADKLLEEASENLFRLFLQSSRSRL